MNCKSPNKIIIDGQFKKWVPGFQLSDLKHKDFHCIVPCKRCWACKKSYGFNWGIRNYIESKDSKHNWFITLTYNDHNLPINSKGYAIINYSDIQAFFRKLRRDGHKIRYFGSSEYGGKTWRPHYHFNIFNLDLKDLKYYKKSGNYKLYNSPYLEKKWNKGHVVIGELDLATTFYICNYQLKKINRDKELMNEKQIPQEMSYMSKNPSIGLSWIYKNMDVLLENKQIPIAFKNETLTIPLPASYKRHFIDLYQNSVKRLDDLYTKEYKTLDDYSKIKKYENRKKQSEKIYHHLKEQNEIDVIHSMYDLKTSDKDFLKTAENINRLIKKKTKIFNEII